MATRWKNSVVALVGVLLLVSGQVCAEEVAQTNGWAHEKIGPARYQYIWMKHTLAGESLGFDRMAVMGDYSSVAISTATTTVVKSGVGVLRSCQVLGGTLGAITVYDNTAASGTVIAPAFTPTATVPGTQILPDIRFSVGLTIVTAAATILQCSFL